MPRIRFSSVYAALRTSPPSVKRSGELSCFVTSSVASSFVRSAFALRSTHRRWNGPSLPKHASHTRCGSLMFHDGGSIA